MKKWKDMILIEAAKKCPHCGSMDTLKREVGEKQTRWTYFVCSHCQKHFVYKTNWSYYLSYALAILFGELLYLFVLSPKNVNTTTAMISMLIVMLVLKEVFSFLLFALFGACRMNKLN